MSDRSGKTESIDAKIARSVGRIKASRLL
jgi:hypothetical protein